MVPWKTAPKTHQGYTSRFGSLYITLALYALFFPFLIFLLTITHTCSRGFPPTLPQIHNAVLFLPNLFWPWHKRHFSCVQPTSLLYFGLRQLIIFVFIRHIIHCLLHDSYHIFQAIQSNASAYQCSCIGRVKLPLL